MCCWCSKRTSHCKHFSCPIPDTSNSHAHPAHVRGNTTGHALQKVALQRTRGHCVRTLAIAQRPAGLLEYRASLWLWVRLQRRKEADMTRSSLTHGKLNSQPVVADFFTCHGNKAVSKAHVDLATQHAPHLPIGIVGRSLLQVCFASKHFTTVHTCSHGEAGSPPQARRRGAHYA